jgi:multiple sugar transport system substrate-binding protein
MNKHKLFTVIALLVIASMSIAACGGSATAAPTAPPATAVPAQPTAVPAQPTAVPAQPTAVPTTAPTAVPVQPTVAPTAAPTTAPAQPVTLNIWHNWGPDDAKGAPLQSIFKDFMAANPDITIKDSVYVDADIPLKVETASAAKQEPDLVFVQRVGSPLNWTDSGVTLPVNDLIKQWSLDAKFKAVALSNFTQADGKIQAFPMEGYTWPIWYNTSVFKAAGVAIPTTTDDLIAAAKKIRAAGFGPVIASGSDGMGQYLFTLIVQSTMSDEDAAKALAGGDWTVPSAIQGVKLFTQLRDAKVFVDGVEGIDFASGNTTFFKGKTAMSHFGAWSFGDAPKDLLANIQLGGFPLPAGSPHKGPIYYSAYTAKGIWITPNGAAKMDAVKRFVQFIYQPAMIARFVEQAGMTPPLTDVPVDAAKLNPLFVQSLSLSGEVAETPDFFLPAKVQPDMARISQEAFTPGVTADKILADLTALYQANK